MVQVGVVMFSITRTTYNAVSVHGSRRPRYNGAAVIYIENFKNLLVRNHWTDFNIILQKCSFGDPLPRLFKPFGFVKNMAARGWGLFSLYIYIENFKNLLVRTTGLISI